MSNDRGFTVVELLLSAALSAIVVAMVWMWLSSTHEASDRIAGDLDEERDMSFTLEQVLAEISDARPTALCLDPDPNNQQEPSPTTTIPSQTISPCNTRGINWGYWPTVTSGTRVFVAGSPFAEAKADKLCFYALPEDETADPASSQTPWGSCLEQKGDLLLASTLEPETAAKNDDLVAAIESNYKWSSGGTWTERVLGEIATISFEYRDFDGNLLTPASGASLDDGLLDDIAMVTVTITAGTAPDVKELSGTLTVRANLFSPCRGPAAAPTCPRLAAPTGLTLTPGSLKIDASWTAPTGNVPVQNYEVHYKKTSDTDWTSHSSTLTTTSTPITALTAATDYDVRVRATNDADNSDWVDDMATTP